MKKYNLILIVTLGFLTISCNKHDEHNHEVTATINLLEPMENDTIAFGTELHMHGTITGSDELHGYNLSLLNTDNATTLFSASATNHQTSYSFDEHWVNTVTDTTHLEVQVEVELDHDGNKTTKFVHLVALP